MDENKIAANWELLMGVIDTEFSGERKNKLIEMYTHLQDRMVVMPASSFEHFHNCFPGGYVDHVLRVIDCAQATWDLWKRMGSDCSGYTREELIFVALNHDLGKVGTKEEDQYIPNPSDWHRKNQGKIYNNNPNISFMSIPDRGLYLLQDFGIKYSINESMGIKLHDGLYDDSNVPYFKASRVESRLRNNLPIVMHHADHMASQIEYEMWSSKQNTKVKPAPSKHKKQVLSTANADAQDLFRGLFGETK